VLGKPTGSIKSGNFMLLYYDRGKVEFRDEKVTTVDLMTKEELATKKEADKEAEKIAAERRALNTFEGQKLKQEKLANRDFVSSSYSNQVKFWRAFKKKYPNVSVAKEYGIVLEGLEEEIKEEKAIVAALEEKARTEKRIRDLEKRLAESEAREQQHRVIYTAPTVYYYYPNSGYQLSNQYPGYHNPHKKLHHTQKTYPYGTSHGSGYANYGFSSDVYISNGSITLHGSF